MKKSNDRRIRYTRYALQNALIVCMQQKPFNRITVREICETADINRSTFYMHYKDIYELLDEIEEQVYQEIDAIFPKNRRLYTIWNSYWTMCRRIKRCLNACSNREAALPFPVSLRFCTLTMGNIYGDMPEMDFLRKMNISMNSSILGFWAFYRSGCKTNARMTGIRLPVSCGG